MADASAASAQPLGSTQAVRERLFEKLVEENRLLLQEIDKFKADEEAARLRLKKSAAEVMDRLLQENAWYRKENESLVARLNRVETQAADFKKGMADLIASRHASTSVARTLQKHVDTLREQKADFEYQARHLGAAFLTLRKAVLTFVASPLGLEAQRSHAEIQDPHLRAAIIEVLQLSHRMKLIASAVDNRLANLRLLDPAEVVAPGGRGGEDASAARLELFGQRLVEENALRQARKERQLWQHRYVKAFDENVKLKAKLEAQQKEFEDQAALTRKTQAQKAVAAKTSYSNTVLRNQIRSLQESNAKQKEALEEKDRQLTLYKKLLQTKAHERSTDSSVPHDANLPPKLREMVRNAMSGSSQSSTAAAHDFLSPPSHANSRSPSIVLKPPSDNRNDDFLSPTKSRAHHRLPPKHDRSNDRAPIESYYNEGASRSRLMPSPSRRVSLDADGFGGGASGGPPPLLSSSPSRSTTLRSPSRATTIRLPTTAAAGQPSPSRSTTIRLPSEMSAAAERSPSRSTTIRSPLEITVTPSSDDRRPGSRAASRDEILAAPTVETGPIRYTSMNLNRSVGESADGDGAAAVPTAATDFLLRPASSEAAAVALHARKSLTDFVQAPSTPTGADRSFNSSNTGRSSPHFGTRRASSSVVLTERRKSGLSDTSTPEEPAAATAATPPNMASAPSFERAAAAEPVKAAPREDRESGPRHAVADFLSQPTHYRSPLLLTSSRGITVRSSASSSRAPTDHSEADAKWHRVALAAEKVQQAGELVRSTEFNRRDIPKLLRLLTDE